MIRRLSLRLSLMALLALLGALMVSGNPASAESRVPFPRIPKALGATVHDGVAIRSEHMKRLFHQRDETMRQGIRPKDERLQGCLSCHAVKGEDGHAVNYEDPKHFCRVCHDYAAVKIDCFECHASTPDVEISAGGTQ